MERIFCPYLTNMSFTAKWSVRFLSDFLIPRWVGMSHLLCTTIKWFWSSLCSIISWISPDSNTSLFINLGNICYSKVVSNTLWVKRPFRRILGLVRVFFPEKYAYGPWLWMSMCTHACTQTLAHPHTHSASFWFQIKNPLPSCPATWSLVMFFHPHVGYPGNSLSL